MGGRATKHETEIGRDQLWASPHIGIEATRYDRRWAGPKQVGSNHRNGHPVESQRVPEWPGNRPRIPELNNRMILQVLSNWQVLNWIDPELFQRSGWSYSRQHQYLRGVIDAACDDNLFVSRRGVDPRTSHILNASGSRASQDNLCDQRACADHQIGAPLCWP